MARASESVGQAQERERMLPLRAALADTLLDVTRGNRAIRRNVVWIRLRHLPEHRPADLHRVGIVLRLHAPGTVVARATLHGGDRRAGDKLQRFSGLLAHVLHPRMAGYVIRNPAERVREVRLEQP